jgi:hypothetical protein
MINFILDKLRSLWDIYKGKLYLRSCVIQIKIVLPNRVKNENIFVVAFRCDKNTCPVDFAIVDSLQMAGSIGKHSMRG